MTANTPASSSHRSRNLVRAVVIAMACISVALLLSVDVVYLWLQRGLMAAEPLISAHPWLGALVFVVLAGISAILAFFSSTLLVPAAVYTWGNTLTAILLWIGWLLGGMFAYSLGHGMRRPAGQDGGPPSRFAAYLPKASAPVGFPLVLLWQLVLPSEIPGYLCGYLGVPFRTYVAAVAVAELPYAIGAVLVGNSVVNRHTGWLAVLGVLAAVLGYFLVRMLHRRQEQG
jgi:uncharacterized membrane protein YdjX (TVP38/TMEM64 family)